jgi:predicted unusual protein kinase regulating ubiquinone biosynthesis (AarF/ABC1/UbiB family)
MAEIPDNAITRGMKLASLPLGMAGRAAGSVGKRAFGVSAEDVAADFQAKTAEQIFAILGELKGGAMKMGQALSIFESALPEEIAAPYRATLTKLQDSAPPMPESTVNEAMSVGLGANWREKFAEFNMVPAAAASIGQVHRATWHDGREVAVKIQYPGAAKAIDADVKQATRIGKMVGLLAPGLDMQPLLDEIRDRIIDELDYIREAKVQRAFAAAFEDDPEFAIPHVVVSSPSIIVTEWLDGTPLSKIITDGTQEQRDRAGLLYERFLLSAPSRCGYMHSDPHPGNFRMTADGRLGVLDFGAVAHFPDGLPYALGALLRVSLYGNAEEVLQGLRDEGFVLPGIDIDAGALHDYLAPFAMPAGPENFTFTRDWMREQFSRVNDPRNPDFTIGLKINLPPSYMLIHRVWLGSIGVLCQIECTIPARGEIERWVPGFVKV